MSMTIPFATESTRNIFLLGLAKKKCPKAPTAPVGALWRPLAPTRWRPSAPFSARWRPHAPESALRRPATPFSTLWRPSSALWRPLMHRAPATPPDTPSDKHKQQHISSILVQKNIVFQTEIFEFTNNAVSLLSLLLLLLWCVCHFWQDVVCLCRSWGAWCGVC